MSFSISNLSAKRLVFAGQKWNQRIVHKRNIQVFSQTQERANSVSMHENRFDEKHAFAFSKFGKTRSIFSDKASHVYGRNNISLISSHSFSTAANESQNSVVAENVAEAVNTGPLDLTDVTYWPIDLVVRLLDGIHTTTGLPWWLSIIALGIGVRTIGTPFTVLTKVHSARLAAANEDAGPLKEKLEKLKERGASKEETGETVKQLYSLYVHHGTNPFTLMGLVFMQIPLYSLTFFGTRRLCENFTELTAGGDYWFSDLSVSDPTYGIAVVTSTLMVANILIGGEDSPTMTKEQEDTKKRMKSLGMAMGFGIIPINMFLPAGVMLYFASTSAMALSTSLLLKAPGSDRLFGYHRDTLPGVIAKKSKADDMSTNTDAYTYVAPHKRERINRRRDRRNNN